MWTSAGDPLTPSGDLRTRRAHRRRRIVHRAAAHVPKRLGCDAQALRYLQNACAPEKSAPELYGEMYRECITTFLPTTRLHAVLLVSSAVQNVMSFLLVARPSPFGFRPPKFERSISNFIDFPLLDFSPTDSPQSQCWQSHKRPAFCESQIMPGPIRERGALPRTGGTTIHHRGLPPASRPASARVH